MQNSTLSPLSADQLTFEAEAMVIGAMILEGDLFGQVSIDTHHFVIEENRMIYEAMKRLESKGEPIELTSIALELGDEGIKRVTFDYIGRVAESIATTSTIDFYVGKVKEFARDRETKYITSQYLNGEITREDMVAKINEIDLTSEVKTGKTIGEIQTEVYADLQLDKGEISGIPTGFKDLDVLLDGMQGGDVIIVGARPGAGKTVFALNVGKNVAELGYSDSVFNYEMKSLAIGRRIIANAASVASSHLKNGSRMTDQDWERFSTAAGPLATLPMVVHPAPGMTVRDIRKAVIQDMHRFKGKKHVAIIDYLGLVEPERSYANAPQSVKIGEMSRALKKMALDLDIPVIVLSQLSRKVEERQDKRPMMSDLRDSGSIEQDADAIIMLYRDDYYYADSDSPNVVEAIVLKQRDGATGTVKLGFRKEYSSMISLER